MSVAAGSETRMGRWVADPGFGVYVHVPFCRHRCHYCDFNTYEGLEHEYDSYVDALIADIGRWDGETRPATSVFFGGGTPTLLRPVQLGRVLDAVRDRCGLAPGAEVTVEANPETVDERYFEALLDAGFNRVSLGVQSLVGKVLVGLGRTHGSDAALGALAAARRAGFDDVNVDLIYGSPWESDGDWITSLHGTVDAAPDHVSAYALTVEDGTPLATLVATGRMPDVDPDLQARRHAVADAVLGAAGYTRYEVSNWARPGRASAHNVLYWCAGDYLGFGSGAHGHVRGERWWTAKLPREFTGCVNRGVTTRGGGETLRADARAGEALMLGLRLASGIDVAAFAARFGTQPLVRRAPDLDRLIADGLLERVDGTLRCTARGTMLSNEVAVRLL
ncbi:MAG TPA: radical SAM family heme chaperone HemW [Actinomycetota bacterium]|nr:radical SAM family heme chaperone HemW [Actinomycetota bacterium]